MRALHSLLVTPPCPSLSFLNDLDVRVLHLPEFVWDDDRTFPRIADVHDFGVHVCEALCMGHRESLVAYVFLERVLVRCHVRTASVSQARQLWLVCCIIAKKTCNDERIALLADAADAFEGVSIKQLAVAEAKVFTAVDWNFSIDAEQYLLYHKHLCEGVSEVPRIF